jgi:hypothetical protein
MDIREIRKVLLFSDSEWEKITKHLEERNLSNFGAYARSVILNHIKDGTN